MAITELLPKLTRALSMPASDRIGRIVSSAYPLSMPLRSRQTSDLLRNSVELSSDNSTLLMVLAEWLSEPTVMSKNPSERAWLLIAKSSIPASRLLITVGFSAAAARARDSSLSGLNRFAADSMARIS